MYIYSAFATDKFGYLNNLIDKTQYCFYIIGSSGNGKNYLMKRIGKYFENKVTYFFCSFDNDSLDGVLIDNRVLIFDSVYPHNVLPTLYKVNGEIINLGDGIDIPCDEYGVIKSIYNKEKMAKYEYIKYGKILHNLLNLEYDYFDNLNLTNQKNQIKEILLDTKIRTNNSIISDVYYNNEYLENKRKISINCSNRMLSQYLLTYSKNLLDSENTRGIVYHNPYNDRFVKAMEYGNIYIGSNLAYGENIDIYGENILDIANIRQVESKIKRVKKEALYLHKKLERAYKPYIDFDYNDKIFDKMIIKINRILKEKC